MILGPQIGMQVACKALHELLTTPPKKDAANDLPTELFEMVLLHLSLQELIRVQRVSKSWRMAITGFSKIQQVLFLKPYQEQEIDVVWEDGQWWKRHCNSGRRIRSKPMLNPFMKDLVDCGAPWRRTGFAFGGSAALKNSVLHGGDDDRDTDLWSDPCSDRSDPNIIKYSIQRMLPMQPATLFLTSSCPDKVPKAADPDFIEAHGWDDKEDEIMYKGQATNFSITPHAARGGFVRIGDMIHDFWNHWSNCHGPCESNEEIQEWRWDGDDDVELLGEKVDEITGYQMLQELQRWYRG